MAIKRSMDLLEIVAECEIMSDRALDRFIDKNPTLADVEWEIEILSYTPGRPATMYQANGDPGDPAEPAEVEIDMGPDEVAGMAIKMIVPLLDYGLVVPTNLWKIWQAVWQLENKWQYENLDEMVWEEKQSDERY